MADKQSQMHPDSGKSFREDDSIFQRADYWDGIETQFTELRTVPLTNEIEVKSNVGFTRLRDIGLVDGSTVTPPSTGRLEHTGQEFKLSVTSSGSTQQTQLETAEKGRYTAGYGAEAGIGMRMGEDVADTSTQQNGLTARWGAFTNRHGFFFQRDGQGLAVGRRSSGVDSVIRSSNFNGTTQIGNALTGGRVWDVRFSYYGYGTIEFGVHDHTTNKRQKYKVLHRLQSTGEVSVDDPNLPVSAEIDQNGESKASTIFVTGRKFAVVGPISPNRRRTSHTVTSVSPGTAFQPIMGFRRKAEQTDGPHWDSVSVKPSKLSVITTEDAEFEIVFGGTLSSTNWKTPSGAVSSGETSVQVVDDATAINGTIDYIDGDIVEGGGKKSGEQNEAQIVNFDLARRQPIAVRARGLGASVSTMHMMWQLREEF